MLGIIRRTMSILTERERRKVIPLVLMMVVGGLLESFSVALVIPLIAGIMDVSKLKSGILGDVMLRLFGERSGQSYLAILLGIMIVAFICKNAFLLWRTYMQNKAACDARERVQNRLFHYYLSRPYSYFLNADSGEVLRTVTTDSDHFCGLYINVLGFIMNLIITSIMSLVVFVIHPQITLLLVAALFAQYVVIVKLFRPYLHDQGQKYRTMLRQGNGLVVEAVRGIKTIKVGEKEQLFERRYALAIKELVHARTIELSAAGAPHRFIEAITVSTLLVYLIIVLLTNGEMTGMVPVLSAFVLAASRILPCVSGISSSVSNSHYYEGTLSRIEQIDKELKCEEAAERSAGPSKSGVLEAFKNEIVLKDIRFSYSPEKPPVLLSASITIPHNHSIGIVGPSGSGKTTLVDILLGILEKQEGSITMDGVEVDTTCSEWHKLFAYIPQNIFMLSGTIRDNVTFGQEDSSPSSCDDRIWEALEIAQLADYVRSLEKGLDTEVGEAGIRLSGGQIQRLGIARAIYSDAPILVLDEATSALDNETESALMDAIASIRGTKTLVIIAHRLSTIENCDTVYRVEDGAVFEETSNEESLIELHASQGGESI